MNLVTPRLFARFPTLEAFCEGTVEEIGELIRSCGFYNTKSKDILGMCLMIRDEFGGQVPDTIEELTRLPGVGRKTANLIVGDIYHKPAVVTDTHCIRIAGRLGLTENTAPEKVENDLRAILPPEESNDFCTGWCSTAGRCVPPARPTASSAAWPPSAKRPGWAPTGKRWPPRKSPPKREPRRTEQRRNPMEKSKVYFTNLRTTFDCNLLQKLKKLITAAGIGKIDFTNKYAAIKIHFGEPGNLAFLRPNYAKVVADTVKELGGKPFLTDCNTLYVGGRKKRPGPPGRRL